MNVELLYSKISSCWMDTELLNKYKFIEPIQIYWMNTKLLKEYRFIEQIQSYWINKE